MSGTHVILNVHLEAVPGHEEELAEQLLALVAPTRGEPGNLAYELHRDPENPAKFMFYERFLSQEALDAHNAAPHFKRWQAYRATAKPDPVAASVVTKWRAINGALCA
jgi:quinol monooxygenase YgiN